MSEFSLNTERFVLNEFEVSDAEYLYQLNSDPEVLKYTGDPPFSDIEDARQFVRSYDAYQKTGVGRWAVRLKSTGEFIGWCGLRVNKEDVMDIGFRIFQKHWNRGYATEAAQVCLEFAFQELNQPFVVGNAMEANHASIAVLKKLGMAYWKDISDPLHEAKCYKLNNPMSI